MQLRASLSQILSQAAFTYRFDEWYGQSSLVATAIVVGDLVTSQDFQQAPQRLLPGSRVDELVVDQMMRTVTSPN